MMDLNPTDMIRHRAVAQRGLTLIELLVVLLILAVLAGAAFQATTGVVDQSRYEATQQLLTTVESAVLGQPDLRDDTGAVMVTGFVADLGRLPHAIEVEAGEPLVLEELWRKPEMTETFELRTPAGDQQVRLATGWRGPYVRLGVGGQELLDGWGRRPRLLQADHATATQADEPVDILRSYASDGAFGITDADTYSEDLSVTLGQRTADPAETARHLASVHGQVTVRDNSGDLVTPPTDTVIVVRLYGPSPLGDGQLVTLAQFTAAYEPGAVTWTTTVLDEDAEPQTTTENFTSATVPEVLSFRFDGMTIGPRVLRAYAFTDPSGTLPPDLEERLDDRNDMTSPVWAPVDMSRTRSIMVVSGGAAAGYSLELDLP